MIGTIATAAQAAMGLGQMIAGAAKPKPIIPEAEIPQEVFQNMSDAEYWAFIGLPETQKQEYIENVTRTSASALSASGDRKGGLGVVTQVAQNEADAWKNMLKADEEARFRNQQTLYGTRDRVAQERVRADEINRNIKIDERDRRDQLIGAGLQNMMGAGGTLAMMDAINPGSLFSKKAGGSTSTSVSSVPGNPNDIPFANLPPNGSTIPYAGTPSYFGMPSYFGPSN